MGGQIPCLSTRYGSKECTGCRNFCACRNPLDSGRFDWGYVNRDELSLCSRHITGIDRSGCWFAFSALWMNTDYTRILTFSSISATVLWLALILPNWRKAMATPPNLGSQRWLGMAWMHSVKRSVDQIIYFNYWLPSQTLTSINYVLYHTVTYDLSHLKLFHLCAADEDIRCVPTPCRHIDTRASTLSDMCQHAVIFGYVL
jgi:hypothetical protein